MSENDLSFVTTRELWEEIQNRSDAAVLIIHNDIDDHSTGTGYYYSGGMPTAIGLMTMLSNRITADDIGLIGNIGGSAEDPQ